MENSILAKNGLRLTPYQEIFYYEWLQDPSRNDYNLVMDNTLSGNLDIDQFRTSLDRLINEHFIFSHNIENQPDGLYWKQRKPATNALIYHPEELPDSEIYQIVSEPFDLENDLYIRIHLIKLNDTTHRIIFIFPHIAIDGLSTDEMYVEWGNYYNDNKYRTSKTVHQQIKLHQNLYTYFEKVLTENKSKIHNFWENRLKEVKGIDLSFLKNSSVPDSKTPRLISEYTFSFNTETFNKVRSLKSYKITPYIFGQIIFGILLHKISGQNHIGITYPIAKTEGKDLFYGAHINTLIIDYHIHSETTLGDLIENALSFFKDLKVAKAKYLPINEIAKYLSDTSVMDIGFAQTFLRDHAITLNGLSLKKANHKFQIDLVNTLLFEQEQYENQLNYRVRYDKQVLDEKLVYNFIQLYKKLFFNVLEDLLKGNTAQKAASYSLLSQEQYNEIIYKWNKTNKPYPVQKTIQTLFEEQVEKTPDAIAFVYKDLQLTYRELNERANQLASYLIDEYTIQPDDLIGLCLDRSENMLISILAVLKSGGAYIPIAPSIPDERLSFILSDAKPKILVTNQIHKDRLKKNINSTITQIESIDDNTFTNLISSYSLINLETSTSSHNLAYVIYTSGTTGQPKGVMIEHKSMVNLALMQGEKFGLNYEETGQYERCLWYANYVFDAHVSEVFTALIKGHSLYMVSGEERTNLQLLHQFITDNSISVATIPPVLLDKDILLPLKTLIVAGDVTNPEVMENYRKNQINVINAYGPTEATVCSTLHYFNIGDTSTNIGSPIPNTKAYVLDSEMNPLPIGVTGELYLGGTGIARGYLNNPELTADKFLNNPFQTEEEKKENFNNRIYKTGDLVKYTTEGELEYIGRTDFQVKIRGYRIELGEIDTHLSSQPGIKKAASMVKKNHLGAKYIAAYYVSETPIDTEELRNYLENYLPDYMIPSVYVHLTDFPVTVNGKLDYKALPEPNFTHIETYIAPENELEKQLCRIFSEVLGLDPDKIGVEDDFLLLGGDSISSIQLISRLRQQMRIHISVKDIFKHKTVRALSSYIETKGDENTIQIRTEQGRLEGELSLLPIQKWFFNKTNLGIFPAYNQWNQTFMLEVPALDQEILLTSLQKLQQHHDAFRLCYKKDTSNGNYQQYYSNTVQNIPFDSLSLQKLKTGELETVLDNWQKSLDIFNEKLWHVGYIDGYPDESARLHFTFHHLIVDAVSWRIIKNDLQTIYEYLLTHSHETEVKEILGSKGSSYRQWINALSEYKETYSNEFNYWENVSSGISSANQILSEKEFNKWNHSEFSLDQANTHHLLRDIHTIYNTQVTDVFLTSLSLSLQEFTGQKDHYITLEGHGREAIFPDMDINNTMGWFTTMYPVKLSNSDDSLSTLTRIKDMIREIPNNGFGYGALIGYTEQELPKISFNYLGQFNSQESSDNHSWNFSQNKGGSPIAKENKDTNLLSINCGIIEEQLHFSIGGNLTPEQLSDFIDLFTSQLNKLIDQLLNKQRSYLTSSDINFIINQNYLNEIQAKKEIEHVFLANSLQQGFIYHSINQGDIDDAYRTQLIWEYQGSVNEKKLKDAWIKTQQKYPSLRIRFSWEEELVQIIDKEGSIDWRYSDITSLSKKEQEQYLEELLKQDQAESYDLSEGNLFRLYLVKRNDSFYTCIFNNHHAILDGWSNPILLMYVHNTYLNLLKDESVYPVIDSSYPNAQRYLQDNREQHLNFWEEYLAPIESNEDLSSLLKPHQRHIALSDYKHIQEPQDLELSLEKDIYKSLKDICISHGVTLNTLLQYSWHKQLSIYGASQITITGMTVAGRNIPVEGVEESVGLYINTLPVLMQHHEGSILDQVKELQSHINEINNHSDINLAKLQKGGNRLFNTLFVFENYPMPEDFDSGSEFSIKFKEIKEKQDYPLVITAYEKAEEVKIKLQYAGELFDQETIQQVLNGISLFLHQLITNPSVQNHELTYLNDSEYNQIIYKWNSAEKKYPLGKTIPMLVEEQARANPDSIAVVYQNIRLTYQELNEQANYLANYLKDVYSIQPDDLIGLALDRSENTVISILAVLKSGAAYVPMDPNAPEERLVYMMNDASPKVILTHTIHQKKLEQLSDSAVISIDEEDFLHKLRSQYTSLNPEAQIRSAHLAYVIYTSGTTGNPKGVLVEHENVINLFRSTEELYHFNSTDVWTLFHSYTFDFSVWELWGPLFYGGKLIIPTYEQTRDIQLFYDLCVAEKVTVLNQTPNAFYQFADIATQSNPIDSLRYIIFGGEALNPEQLKPWYKIYNDTAPTLINMYGITETTVHVTYKKIKASELDKGSFIGVPIPNYKSYVLNADRQPLPIGATGELYVSGSGVTRGYLNNPELTADRFLPNPFQTKEEKQQGINSRLYKSGDLVRQLPDGSLEYIGRNDFQVKIRGFRIELGEIESRLSSYPEIRQSVVLAREHGNGTKFLAGYYVADQEIDRDTLHSYLNEYLPEYMVPSVFIFMEEFPLTINGKLDRKALPDPEFSDTNTYVAPQNEREEQLCRIYAEVLGISSVGIEDDFFRLGGDSISSIQLVNRLRQRMNIHIHVKDVFTHRTVKALYTYSVENSTNSETEIQSEQGTLQGEVPLLPIQEWFFDHINKGLYPSFHHWNQAFMIKVPSLDKQRLTLSIQKLLEHHDAFSLKYTQKDQNSYGQFYQYSDSEFALDCVNLKELTQPSDLDNILNSWQNQFNIFSGPLFHIGYLEGYPDGSARIHFALHHLIVDAVSWRIIINDLQTIYDYLETHQEKPVSAIKVKDILGKKGSSYRQWVNTLRTYENIQPEEKKAEKEYWEKLIQNISENNRILASKATEKRSQLEISFDSILTQKIVREVPVVYGTRINDFLLSALALSLQKVTGTDENYILLEGHGRENISRDLDITNTMGWFTSLYPVCLNAKGKNNREVLIRVKDYLKQIPNEGIGYGALIGYTQKELPKVSFNYLGQFNSSDNNEEWSFNNENIGIPVAPENKDNLLLNINGGIIEGKLQFSIAGNLEEKELQQFTELYKKNVEQLAEEVTLQSRSYLTLSDVDYLVTPEYLNKIQAEKEIEGIYKANSLQQGFIYHALHLGDVDESYRTQLLWDYHGFVNEQKLKEAWACAQAKYPALRIRFDWEEELVQIIDKEGIIDWRYLDISNLSGEEQEKYYQDLLLKDRNEGYHLDKGNLFRIYIIKRNENYYNCIFNNHHAILDGWSNPVLLAYVHETYLNLLTNKPVSDKKEDSYTAAQKYLQNHQLIHKEYWENYLKILEDAEDLSALLKINKRHINLSEYKYIEKPETLDFNLKGNLYKRIKSLCSTHGITVNALLQYCWHKQLHLYSSAEVTTLGMTVSGRNIPVDGIEQSVGLYINTLPVLLQHHNIPAIESLKELQNTINEVNSHSGINLVKLQKGGTRLFNSLFIFENYPAPEDTHMGDNLSFTFRGVKEKQDYPLVVTAYEQQNEIVFKLQYAGELFETHTIQNILARITMLLEQLVENPDLPAHEYNHLLPAEYKTIIKEWNQTKKTQVPHKTFSVLFEEQAEKTPDALAVMYENNQLTYRELNEQANRLARFLQENYQVKPDDLVGLCLSRSETMLVALLAILKSGAAYVPMDPEAPIDRLTYIINQAQTKVIFTHQAHKRKLEQLNLDSASIEILDNPEFWNYLQSEYPTDNIPSRTLENNLIYVLFTSGTTGNPKGVMIEHRSYLNLLYHYKNSHFKKEEKISTLSITNYVFDIWGLEYGLPLLSGGTLELSDSNFKQLDASKYNFIQMTPSLLSAKLDQIIWNNDQLKILVGGEAISKELLNQVFSNPDLGYLLNVYGPTETTIWSTDKKNTHQSHTTSIGRPLANTTTYVLNKYKQAVPVGVIGELYIGGTGVGRGYLNNPELTNKQFIPNPFQSKEEKQTGYNSRIYKTGDLVRYLPDGNLEYIGRNDFQVKIRGFRIELEEIETCLLSYPEIRQAVVLAKEQTSGSHTKYLVAYYVSDQELDHTLIQEHLNNHLPEYMVPSVYIHLEKPPLTVNGKLNRKELPQPQFTDTHTYEAPQNQTEKQLCEIYGSLLGIETDSLSVLDDFFRLGGDSILAIRLVNKINKELNRNIHISSIFTYKTIRQLADHLLSEKDSQIQLHRAKFTQPEDQILSFAQERLWFIESYEGGSNAYNIPMIFKFKENVHIESVCSAIQEVAERHEVLHSVIKKSPEGNGYQEVLKQSLKIDRINVSSKEMLNTLLTQAVNHIFKLDTEYPIQAKIYTLENTHYMSIVVHHIAFDGWSIGILIREVARYYQYHLLKNQNQEEKATEYLLPELPIQYKDFAIWQRNYLTGNILDKQLMYWKKQLSNLETLNLPTDLPRPAQVDYTGEDLYFTLNATLSQQLRETAKELEVSLYSILLSGYYLLLQAYGNQKDIVVGTPIANRNYPEISDLIGFFVNTLALRQNIDNEQIISDFIKQVGKTVNEAQLHQDVPFEKLVNELNIEKDTSRHPVFQVLFGMQKFGSSSSGEINHLFEALEEENIHPKVAKFDLTLMLDDSENEISGSFNYATSLFHKETIQFYISVYTEIVKQLVTNQKKRIGEISYLDNNQYQTIQKWNDTFKKYPDNKTLTDLFEEQVTKTPDRIAVVYENTKLTYRELDQLSNRLGNYLLNQFAVQPDDRVALYLDRSEYMLIVILAVLKSGAAYVPMDPEAPDERISFMVSDASAKIVVTNDIYEEKLKSLTTDLAVLSIDKDVFTEELTNYPENKPIVHVTPQHMAYVIYTSGTTGNPKGIMVEHSQVVNLVFEITKQFRLDTESTITKNCLWYANYVFDSHVAEVYSSITRGHSLYIIGGDTRMDINLLNQYIISNDIHVATIPPILLDKENILPLQTLVVVGESSRQEIINIYTDREIHILNGYGPSETTVCSNMYPFQKNDKNTIIGKRLGNYTNYILDENQCLLPIGAIGELYIGGAGVSRGYLNNPQLTKERYLDNPFRTEEDKLHNHNSRIYKTGDLVRYRPDGSLEYIGRNDFQVKIRGLRVELGEIESKLSAYTGIHKSIVLAKKHTEEISFLAAYYTSDKELDNNELRKYLELYLPDYMIPSVFVHLDEFPLTGNGKLNMKALPEPDFTNTYTYIAPQNETEKQLCIIYEEILHLDASTISVEDNFFALGGNSILAIKLVNKINQVFNKNIRIVSIFTHKTIRKLADHLMQSHTSVQITKPQVKEPEAQLLSFAQERLWFIESYEGGSNAYNIPIVFDIKDTVTLDSLLNAIKMVVHRHEVLRSLIRTNSEGNGYQIVQDDTLFPLPIERIHLSSVKEKEEAISHAVNHIFKLDTEYPIQVKLYGLSESYSMSIVVHHIAFDGWSINILIKEILNYYQYFELIRNKQEKAASGYLLADLPVQYKDFALWQRNYLTGEVLQKQMDYWVRKLSGYESLILPTDRVRPPRIDFSGADLSFTLDSELSNRIRETAQQAGVSVYSLLLGGYYLMLSAYSNQKDIVIGTAIANRNYPEISNMIGFFVNSLALRQNIDKQLTLSKFIQQVGQTTDEAQLHQDLPFEKIVNELNVETDASKNPIFQVMFTLQNFGEKKHYEALSLLEIYNADNPVAKFDITTFMDDSQEEIKGIFNYATSLFNEETIQSYISTYQLILQQVAENPEKKIINLKYTTITENSFSSTSDTEEEDTDFWSEYEVK